MKIFLSYTLRDGLIDNEKLSQVEAVVKPKRDIYIDVLHNNSVEKQARVERELATSAVVMSLVSPGYFDSPWVQKELGLADQMNIRTIEIHLPNHNHWRATLNKIEGIVENCEINLNAIDTSGYEAGLFIPAGSNRQSSIQPKIVPARNE